jgi:predicted phosphodiesterase
MTRIAIFSDLHANLPALEAFLVDVQDQDCNQLVHLGDAVAIGPFPAECLERLSGLPNARFVMGNHDSWLAHGLPQPLPEWMSAGELAHQDWVRAQVEPELVEFVAAWPFKITRQYGDQRVDFHHYALDDSGADFLPFTKGMSPADFDRQNQGSGASLVFYGHTHIAADMQGVRRYINPGSLGCYEEPLARYCILEFSDHSYSIENRAVRYDDADLYAAFESRAVPEREFLYRAFYGGRFPPA